MISPTRKLDLLSTLICSSSGKIQVDHQYIPEIKTKYLVLMSRNKFYYQFYNETVLFKPVDLKEDMFDDPTYLLWSTPLCETSIIDTAGSLDWSVLLKISSTLQRSLRRLLQPILVNTALLLL